MGKLKTESKAQAVGWRSLGHQGYNKIVQKTGDPQNAVLALYLSGPRPKK